MKQSIKVKKNRKTSARAGRKTHRITKNAGRSAVTAKRTFQKVITIAITGTDVNAIKQTASNIYALQNDHTKGGRDGRKVQITPITSSDVETVFFGRH